MKRWWKLGSLAVAIGVAVGLALLLRPDGLFASGDEQGEVTATVRVSPLVVSLTVPDEPVSRGERFRVWARVENRGQSRIWMTTVTLHLDTSSEPGLRVYGRSTRPLGVLQPGAGRSRGWWLRGEQEGSYVLMATASGFDWSNRVWVTGESDAKVVTIK